MNDDWYCDDIVAYAMGWDDELAVTKQEAS